MCVPPPPGRTSIKTHTMKMDYTSGHYLKRNKIKAWENGHGDSIITCRTAEGSDQCLLLIIIIIIIIIKNNYDDDDDNDNNNDNEITIMNTIISIINVIIIDAVCSIYCLKLP